jgi:hypothetical protein
MNIRVRELAALALGMAHNDIAAAARLLSEWSGLSLDYAIVAIDELIMLDDAPPSDPVEESDPL